MPERDGDGEGLGEKNMLSSASLSATANSTVVAPGLCIRSLDGSVQERRFKHGDSYINLDIGRIEGIGGTRGRGAYREREPEKIKGTKKEKKKNSPHGKKSSEGEYPDPALDSSVGDCSIAKR
jgi:hypothetical protein